MGNSIEVFEILIAHGEDKEEKAEVEFEDYYRSNIRYIDPKEIKDVDCLLHFAKLGAHLVSAREYVHLLKAGLEALQREVNSVQST